jgi:hypothetical protein
MKPDAMRYIDKLSYLVNHFLDYARRTSALERETSAQLISHYGDLAHRTRTCDFFPILSIR